MSHGIYWLDDPERLFDLARPSCAAVFTMIGEFGVHAVFNSINDFESLSVFGRFALWLLSAVTCIF